MLPTLAAVTADVWPLSDVIVHSCATEPSTHAVSLVRLVREALRGRCSHGGYGRLPRVLLVATRSRSHVRQPARTMAANFIRTDIVSKDSD
jgi:hypothetical protein